MSSWVIVKESFIATSSKVGVLCEEWAKLNTPDGFYITDNIQESEVVISVKYDKIFGKEITQAKKCFNFHPAPLPKYKGVGLASWLLINEEEKGGVSLHQINEGIDTGPIIEVREFLISDEDSAKSIVIKSEKMILKMFQDWYNNLLRGDFPSTPQNPKEGKQYTKKDLQKAKDLTNYIKAFYFPNKEPAYYYNTLGEKIYINYK